MFVARRLASRLPMCLVVLLACSPSSSGTTDDGSSSTATDGASSSDTTVAPTTTASTTDTSATDASATDASTTGASATDTSTTDASTTDASTTDTSTSGVDTTDGSTTGDDGTTTASTGETTGDTTGGDGLGPGAQAAIDALELVVDGVFWPSESDYPWLVFGLADAAPVSVDNLKELVGGLVVVEDGEAPLAEQAIEEEPWEDRFLVMTTPQDWWTDYELMRAEQYEAIRATLAAHLEDLKLFRIGEDKGGYLGGAIDMFVIGRTADGDLVGIQTISIET